MVSNEKYRDMVAKSEGLAEGWVQLLREPICSAVTKLSLGIIYHIAMRKTVRIKLVEARAIPLLVEILVNGEQSVCEKSMLVLEILCCCTEGRAAASANALTLSVVVKKMLQISNLATESAVCVLWNVCQNLSDSGAVWEALQAGVFDKLLLIVQVGCSEDMRDKSIKLLKAFNKYTTDWQCAETLHLHHVKRSF